MKTFMLLILSIVINNHVYAQQVSGDQFVALVSLREVYGVAQTEKDVCHDEDPRTKDNVFGREYEVDKAVAFGGRDVATKIGKDTNIIKITFRQEAPWTDAKELAYVLLDKWGHAFMHVRIVPSQNLMVFAQVLQKREGFVTYGTSQMRFIRFEITSKMLVDVFLAEVGKNTKYVKAALE